MRQHKCSRVSLFFCCHPILSLFLLLRYTSFTAISLPMLDSASSPLFIILFLSFYPVVDDSMSYSTHTAASHNIRQRQAAAESEKTQSQANNKNDTHYSQGEKRGDLLSFHSHQRFPPLQCSELTAAAFASASV